MSSVIGRLDDICLDCIVLQLFLRNQTAAACEALGLPSQIARLLTARLQSLLKWMNLHSRLFLGNADTLNSLSCLVRYNGCDVDSAATVNSWLASDLLSPLKKFSLTAMCGVESAARSILNDELDDETRRLVRGGSIDTDDSGSVDVLTTCWARHLLNVHPFEETMRAASAARICAHLGLDDAFMLWVGRLPDDDRAILLPSLLFLCLEHGRFKMVEHLYVNYSIDLMTCFAHRFPDGVVDPKVAALLTSPELSAPIGLEIIEQLFAWLPTIERQKLLWARHSHLLRRAVGRNQLRIVELLLSVASNLGMAGTVVSAKQYEALRLAKSKGFDDIYDCLLEPLPLELRPTTPDLFD
uniref:Uncharacterized protein n=1 Tax=Plectus sambesii TaxID=2011161 RepID=A0A914UXU7_9BILA